MNNRLTRGCYSSSQLHRKAVNGCLSIGDNIWNDANCNGPDDFSKNDFDYSKARELASEMDDEALKEAFEICEGLVCSKARKMVDRLMKLETTYETLKPEHRPKDQFALAVKKFHVESLEHWLAKNKTTLLVNARLWEIVGHRLPKPIITDYSVRYFTNKFQECDRYLVLIKKQIQDWESEFQVPS